MRGVVLDICDKGEIVKLCLMIKLKFWEYKTRFDSKHFIFFWYYHCLWGHPFMASTKKWPTNDPPTSTIRQTRAKFEEPPFCVDKCSFTFRFFKVWSVTYLNVNEILNFMKIQSSYVLPSYQRNQAYISNYIS